MGISGRTASGYNCHYCSNTKVLVGFNDLLTRFPEIAKEWHPTKNIDIPENISSRNSKKAWWIGKCGHEWEASIKQRTTINSGCPICLGRKFLAGFNDLATKYPLVTKEWHPTRNGDNTPGNTYYFTSKKVWWQCEKGHEWENHVYDKVKHNRPCPICSKNGTSKTEEKFRVGFSQYFTEINDSYRVKTKLDDKWYQFDIIGLLNNRKTVIEYDGSYWHSQPGVLEQDVTKTNLLLSKGYLVIRIREKHHVKLESLNIDDKNYYEITHQFGDDVSPVIEKIMNHVLSLK
jgi:hypothetical protein